MYFFRLKRYDQDMRLTKNEVQQIKHYVTKIFGQNSRVLLFGSRVDQNKKGGDIDLLIEPQHLTDAYIQTTKLLTNLQIALGDQKIDIIIATDPQRLIEQEARKNGILL